MFNLFKSKKTESLMDFHSKVGELAKKYGKDHWNTRVEVVEHRNRAVKFDAYIPDLGWIMGEPSIKSILDKFKEKHDHPVEQYPTTEVLI